MLTRKMVIEQTDNGWILEYTGNDCLHKHRVYGKWSEVLKELDEYFGWYEFSTGKLLKKP